MSASTMIDKQIASLKDWRGKKMSEARKLIHQAVPDVTETWKWMGTACFEKCGVLTTLEPYKGWLKLTFLHGADLPDPGKLFNSELEGRQRRAIRITENDKLKAMPFKALIRAATAYYATKPKKKTRSA